MRSAGVHDGAFFHDEHPRAELESGLDVLLHQQDRDAGLVDAMDLASDVGHQLRHDALDRKSTRLNSSHLVISYAVFCLKKKKSNKTVTRGTKRILRWTIPT